MNLAYDLVRVARGGQELMWSGFCEKVCEAAGGEALDDVQMRTFRAPFDEPPSRRAHPSKEGRGVTNPGPRGRALGPGGLPAGG